MKPKVLPKYIRKVSTNGRICIPASYRNKYKIKPGMRIGFVEKDGEIELKVKK